MSADNPLDISCPVCGDNLTDMDVVVDDDSYPVICRVCKNTIGSVVMYEDTDVSTLTEIEARKETGERDNEPIIVVFIPDGKDLGTLHIDDCQAAA